MMGGEFRQGELWQADGLQDPHRWVFHVDMDAFFASVEQLDNSALAGLPVIVCNSPMTMDKLQRIAQQAIKQNHAPEFIKGIRGVVASASYEARAFGVRSAMPLARALALCPHAMVMPGRFDRYREVAGHLRSIWGEFSPVIEPVSLDEAYLDMTGAELSGGPIREIGMRLKERIRVDTGLTASIGIGSNKMVAKVASDLQKPDGLVMVPKGEEAATLAPLPVRALQGVGNRTQTVLDGLGIHTVGQLARANRTVLAVYLGADNADSLMRHAAGIDHSSVEPPGDPKSISRETTLSNDTADLAALKKMLVGLSDQVAWSLRNEGLSARVVIIKLRLLVTRRGARGGDSGFGRLITRRLTLPIPTDSAALVYENACKLLDTAARSTGLRNVTEVVRLIGVGTAGLMNSADLVGQFGGHNAAKGGGEDAPIEDNREKQESKAERERRLTGSIDEIRKRFGYDAIISATAAHVKHEDGGLVDG